MVVAVLSSVLIRKRRCLRPAGKDSRPMAHGQLHCCPADLSLCDHGVQPPTTAKLPAPIGPVLGHRRPAAAGLGDGRARPPQTLGRRARQGRQAKGAWPGGEALGGRAGGLWRRGGGVWRAESLVPSSVRLATEKDVNQLRTSPRIVRIKREG